MTPENKTYVHVTENKPNSKGVIEEKESAVPEKTWQEMTGDFKTGARMTYIETQFDSVQEFVDAKMPNGDPVLDDVKKDIVNRGWVLYQQAAAKSLVINEDPDYVNRPEPVDISGEAFSPKEKRAKGTPETRAKKGLRELLADDPEKLAQLIAEFLNENPQVAAGAVSR